MSYWFSFSTAQIKPPQPNLAIKMVMNSCGGGDWEKD